MLEFVFFDVRDTLGYVDRPGHLVLYRPSTDRLLKALKKAVGRLGIITNLPSSVTAEQGRRMIEEAGITPYLDPAGIIINHEAGASKPEAAIYEYAAQAVGVPLERCCFIGENLVEVLGAQAAGMVGLLKPYPPGGEFKLLPVTAEPATPTSSGRNFELILEEEHLLAKRITVSAGAISAQIREDGKNVPLRAMSLLVTIVTGFVDPFHHRKEEEVLIPFALARGMPRDKSDWVLRQHDQGRAYFRAMEIALDRAQNGEETAAVEFADICEGFVKLYRDHGPREDNELFPEIGKYLSDLDDAIVADLLNDIGPRHPNPWIALVGELEKELGLKPA